MKKKILVAPLAGIALLGTSPLVEADELRTTPVEDAADDGDDDDGGNAGLFGLLGLAGLAGLLGLRRRDTIRYDDRVTR